MQRHRGLLVVTLLLCVGGFASWYATKTWEGWEYILDIVGKGDNMPIAGLIPIIAFSPTSRWMKPSGTTG